MTTPHGARAATGTRGRRRPRRRSGLRSLGLTLPESARPQPAHRTALMHLDNFGSLDSSETTSSVRAASNAEGDGEDGVDGGDSSVEITSVTRALLPARNRACRARPDARPAGDRPYVRLASRCPERRRSAAHGTHRARTEAHPPQNTKTRPHPPQRPNLPSTASRFPTEGLDSRGARRHRDHGERVSRRVRHEGSGVQTRAFSFSDLCVLRRRRSRWR